MQLSAVGFRDKRHPTEGERSFFKRGPIESMAHGWWWLLDLASLLDNQLIQMFVMINPTNDQQHLIVIINLKYFRT